MNRFRLRHFSARVRQARPKSPQDSNVANTASYGRQETEPVALGHQIFPAKAFLRPRTPYPDPCNRAVRG